MEVAQIIAYLISTVLAALGVGFAAQQRATLRRLKSETELADDERSYQRNQALLRLTCCVLMLILGGLVAGAYAFGLEGRATELGKAMQVQRDRGEEPVLTPDERQFRKFYLGYWIVTLLVLLAIVILASIDVWTIRRFQRRQMAKLNADRREMIEEQVAILRSRRNGYHHN